MTVASGRLQGLAGPVFCGAGAALARLHYVLPSRPTLDRTTFHHPPWQERSRPLADRQAHLFDYGVEDVFGESIKSLEKWLERWKHLTKTGQLGACQTSLSLSLLTPLLNLFVQLLLSVLNRVNHHGRRLARSFLISIAQAMPDK